MSAILKRFMQHALAGLNRSRVAGFDPLGDTNQTLWCCAACILPVTNRRHLPVFIRVHLRLKMQGYG
jgi:hypothetical protein